MSLLTETKKALEYEENPGTCKDCKHKITESGVLDREWIEFCTYSNICRFVVKESATCKKCERKN